MLRLIFFSLYLIFLFSTESSFAKDFVSYTPDFTPKSNCEMELNYTYFKLCYSQQNRIATWTLHELTREQINGLQSRSNDFRADLSIPNPVQETDYRRSGYDRGHLVPAADMRLNFTSMSETFYMTNMTPQDPGFNSGVWNALENHIRREVSKLGQAIVITAPVILDTKTYPMLRTRITIPEAFYKIIYFYESQIMKAYLIPNAHARGKSFREFQLTVREIESLTGIDFFSELPDELEEFLETRI